MSNLLQIFSNATRRMSFGSDGKSGNTLEPGKSTLSFASDDEEVLKKDSFILVGEEDDASLSIRNRVESTPNYPSTSSEIAKNSNISNPITTFVDAKELKVGPPSILETNKHVADVDETCETKAITKSPRLYCCRVTLLLSLIAIVAVLTIVLIGKSDRGEANAAMIQENASQPSMFPLMRPSTMPSIQPSLQPTVESSLTIVDLSNLSVKELLTYIAFDNGIALRETGSAQNTAFEWLVSSNTNPQDLGSAEVIQTYALATLFYSTNGNNWERLDNWLASDVNVCFWYSTAGSDACAVDADGSYELTQLSLNNNNLNGQLPLEIGHLASVEIISLNNNNLTGVLPDQLFSKTQKLKQLEIRDNKIEGSFPTMVGLLSHLLYLDFDSNDFKGTLPTEIAMMTALTTLSLNNNFITGTIPMQFSTMSNLRNLYLDGNNLTGKVTDKICALKLADFKIGCNTKIECSCCTDQCTTI